MFSNVSINCSQSEMLYKLALCLLVLLTFGSGFQTHSKLMTQTFH